MIKISTRYQNLLDAAEVMCVYIHIYVYVDVYIKIDII